VRKLADYRAHLIQVAGNKKSAQMIIANAQHYYNKNNTNITFNLAITIFIKVAH
jgi:hypothetical protein